MRHDGLTQIQFFQAMITGYIENDPRIIDFVTSVKLELARQGKKRINKTRDLIKQGEELKKLFNLEEEETKELFDMIAEEFPDL